MKSLKNNTHNLKCASRRARMPSKLYARFSEGTPYIRLIFRRHFIERVFIFNFKSHSLKDRRLKRKPRVLDHILDFPDPLRAGTQRKYKKCDFQSNPLTVE